MFKAKNRETHEIVALKRVRLDDDDEVSMPSYKSVFIFVPLSRCFIQNGKAKIQKKYFLIDNLSIEMKSISYQASALLYLSFGGCRLEVLKKQLILDF